MSSPRVLSAEDRRAEKIRRKAGRFRILIVGRANAGKTTILQKVCNTTEDPAIYDAHGTKRALSVVDPSSNRGLHNVNDEMVFQSNPGFIFHDSRGFEAGNVAELNDVKNFIARRAAKEDLADQLHAIWYCIPVDNNRLITRAEETFFSECGTGHVPVIVIFTKFDAMDDKAFAKLENEDPDIDYEEAARRAPLRAQQDFEKLRPGLRIFHGRYPPKDHMFLRGMIYMNNPAAHCIELLEKTASALDNRTLQRLFVSTQQCTVDLCTKYAMANSPKLYRKRLTAKQVQQIILPYYPHFTYVSHLIYAGCL